MIKEQKAITLISLVITIIIMLILANVSIDLTLGENGIIARAKEAKKRMEIATIKEQIQMDILTERLGNNGKILEDKIKEILEKYGDLSEEEKLEDKILTTDEGKYEIKVSDIINGETDENSDKDPEIVETGEANIPNVKNIAQKTYVTWELNEAKTEYVINDTQTTPPTDWYDYENGKWANIKTTNEGLEAYWVWIPRYEYIVPTGSNATQIEVRFITTNTKEGSKGYTKQSDGTIKSDDGYTIHPVFTNEGNGGFGELDGIWVAKFEASSSSPTSNNGGATDTSLKVQIRPNVTSWRSLSFNDIPIVCNRMTDEVLKGSKVDSHMMKNMEWGAVAILSQSKYGIYNPKSATGINGDKTYKVQRNLDNSYTTGNVTTIDGYYATSEKYNSINGPKASTTGTVSGIYDMNGCGHEYVAGYFVIGTPEKSKYYDLYNNPKNSASDFSGAKIGDATKETAGWNKNKAEFVTSNSSTRYFYRGGDKTATTNDGIFNFRGGSGAAASAVGFRVTVIP